MAATDRGVLLGEGIYETCGVINGVPFALRRHLDRLRGSADRIGLSVPWSNDDLRGIVADVLAVAHPPAGRPIAGEGRGDDPADRVVSGRLRITITGGDGPLGPDRRSRSTPTLLVMAGPTHRWDPTSNVVISPWRINEHSPSAGVKSTSHLDGVLALRSAHAAGADEALMVNGAGVLCEGTGSNIFVVVGDDLTTPALETGCLGGITRQLVCEALAAEGRPIVERNDLSVEDLRHAPEAFLTSSTRNVHPIASVDDLRLGASVPGPETERAATLFAALQVQDLDP